VDLRKGGLTVVLLTDVTELESLLDVSAGQTMNEARSKTSKQKRNLIIYSNHVQEAPATLHRHENKASSISSLAAAGAPAIASKQLPIRRLENGAVEKLTVARVLSQQ
jgi:hypothetical protein